MFLESVLGAGGLKGRRSRVTAGAGRGRVRCGPRPPPSFRIHDGTYEPSPVRQVLIPKKQPGKFRPLGIPCLRDRVAQTSAMLVLGPIFEADLEPEQYGYRPGRSAKDAVGRIHRLLNSGRNEVVDADLSNYFGEIPHAELMKSIARRVSDGRMLGLSKA